MFVSWDVVVVVVVIVIAIVVVVRWKCLQGGQQGL
jgi:hypothetical protein